MDNLNKSWVRLGSYSGIAGIIFYFLAVFPLLSYEISRIIAFFIGPLLVVAFLGLYHFINAKTKSPLNLVSVVFAIIAGALINVMLVVQASIKAIMYSRIENAKDEVIKNTLTQILNGLHTVHLGLDISWDIFIGLSLLLFGISMIKARIFNSLFNLIAIIFGGLIIFLNLYSFPIPPANSNLFDIGPFVALYLVILFIMMFYSSIKKTEE